MGGGASSQNPPQLACSRVVGAKGACGEAVLTVCAASADLSKCGGGFRLLKVHRRPEGITMSEEVPIARSSLTGGDSFILDAGTVVCLWSGPNASSLKRTVANEVAKGITNQYDGQATLSIPHGPNHCFWRILDGHETLEAILGPDFAALVDGQIDDEDDIVWI